MEPGAPSQPASGASETCPWGGLEEDPHSPPLEPQESFLFTLFSQTEPSQKVPQFPNSNSSVSLDTSPDASASPRRHHHRDDSSLGFSDSEEEEMDSSLTSDQSEYGEMTSSYRDRQSPPSADPAPNPNPNPLPCAQGDPIEGRGQSGRPFAKDKARRRSLGAGRQTRLSRDQQRAKALAVPFTVERIINLPVDDFNDLMSRHHLNPPQLALVRDIRRRGKNKVAAQNCRKRKMEGIWGLEGELEALQGERGRLLEERAQGEGTLRGLKEQLNSLYLEVFSLLRDEDGQPYAPHHYSLQQTSDGSMFLVPRHKKTLKSNDD